MIAPIPVLAQRAEVVTICGSSKFKREILAEVARLTIEGKLVVSLGVFGHHDLPDYNWDTDASDLKTMLDALHRQKIDMADSVHVVNPDGYYGESTAREIAYARSVGKPVTFMLPDVLAEVEQCQGDCDSMWCTARSNTQAAPRQSQVASTGEPELSGTPIPDPDPTGEYPEGWHPAVDS